MSAADVLNKINEYGVKFVDFRFTDTKGKEQHIGSGHGCISRFGGSKTDRDCTDNRLNANLSCTNQEFSKKLH